ncbi:MAG: VOC family protein [Paracoccaceae bacterium]
MTFKPNNFAVWTEIPVSDLDKGIAFYGRVFRTELEKMEMGPDVTAIFPTATPGGVAGHIYEGTPAGDGSGPTVHLACPDALEDTMQRVRDAGGEVLSEPIQIPVGRFAYARDPDGNSLGLFSA